MWRLFVPYFDSILVPLKRVNATKENHCTTHIPTKNPHHGTEIRGKTKKILSNKIFKEKEHIKLCGLWRVSALSISNF